MRFIAASKDGDAINELQHTAEFQSVDIQTVQLLNACTNSKIPVIEGEEEVNMCKGLDDLMARHRREGKAEERANLIRTALHAGSTPGVIAKVMCIPIEEVNAIANQNDSITK